jgi:hypothetical protein
VKKDYLAKFYTFLGLVVVSVAIFVMSVLAKNVEDTRILGVHVVPTVVPTVKPTVRPTVKPTTIPTTLPTQKPTAAPTPFTGCKANGTAVSSPSLCCSGRAVYVWSSYVCGEGKPTSVPTLKPTIIQTFGVGLTKIPTIKTTNCQAGALDVSCINPNGWKCKWYRNENCSWICNQNCVAPRQTKAGILNESCVNDSGQTCQKYQYSDGSTECNQNCKDKSTSFQNSNSVMVKAFNNMVSNVYKGSCKAGVDYNSDGVTNSLDFSFCRNNKSAMAKNIDNIVGAVNKGIPIWFEWIVSKMGM